MADQPKVDPAVVSARHQLWRRNPTGARAQLTDFMARQPRDATGPAYRSLCFRAEGKLSEALADADRALALDPNSTEALAAQSIALFTKKKVGAAIGACRRIAGYGAQDVEGYFLHLLADSLVTESFMEGLNRQRDMNNMPFVQGPITKAAFNVLDCRFDDARKAFPGGVAPRAGLVVMVLGAFRMLEEQRISGGPVSETIKAGCLSSLKTVKLGFVDISDRALAEDIESTSASYWLDLGMAAAMLSFQLENPK